MTEKLSAEEYSEKIKIFDQNFADVKNRINLSAQKSGRTAKDITLLAATKTVPTEVINYAIDNGLNFIGENKVQEFLQKEEALHKVTRHFIGHLQRNKVKDIIGKVDMIESVDSFRLAEEISKQSIKKGIVTKILIEVNIGYEQTKSGILPENLLPEIENIAKLNGITVKGLMAIPPKCEDKQQIKKYFSKMFNLFIDIKAKNIDNSSIEYLSMGMSEDFEAAIEEGANIVRIGSRLFGKRIYL